MYKVVNFALKECKGGCGCSGFVHTSCIKKHIDAYFSTNQMTTGDECNNAMKQHKYSTKHFNISMTNGFVY
jgi:hypothetical protein